MALFKFSLGENSLPGDGKHAGSQLLALPKEHLSGTHFSNISQPSSPDHRREFSQHQFKGKLPQYSVLQHPNDHVTLQPLRPTEIPHMPIETPQTPIFSPQLIHTPQHTRHALFRYRDPESRHSGPDHVQTILVNHFGRLDRDTGPWRPDPGFVVGVESEGFDPQRSLGAGATGVAEYQARVVDVRGGGGGDDKACNVVHGSGCGRDGGGFIGRREEDDVVG